MLPTIAWQPGKLSRPHAMLVEVLNRHCGKGQQKIIVERVNVVVLNSSQSEPPTFFHISCSLSIKTELLSIATQFPIRK
jgi:hypothetical protein